jgi:4-hydroxy-tetrahydrodipicolinate synthase
MIKMSHLCLEDRFQEASKLQLDYMSLIDALFVEVNPIPVKAALDLLGKEAGPLRLPLCDISPANLDVLKVAMSRCGLL